MTGELINTIEAPGEFDALTTLQPGEPYFVLVGRDRFAPDLVKDWAHKNRLRAFEEFDAGTIDAEERDRELRKSTQAEAIGWSMTAFKAGHEVKKAAGDRATYSGHETSDEIRKRDRLSRQRHEAKSAINNAVAELNDLLPLLDEQDADQADLANIAADILGDMRNLSKMLQPSRPIGVAA